MTMNRPTSIRSVQGRRVWDSRGRPTIEAEVTLADGSIGRAIAPAGASTGSGEALDKRDGGTSFGGLDVQHALASISDLIAPRLAGLNAADQAEVDTALIVLDGTRNKQKLGGNAMIAVSMAVLHAAAASARLPLWKWCAKDKPVSLPLPEIQIFGGGAHAARRIDVQDFMIMAPSATSFAEALDRTAEVYRAAGEILKAKGLLAGVADEGGYWPAFSSNEEALSFLMEAIGKAGFSGGDDIAISLDIAASEFGRAGRYTLGLEGRALDRDGMIAMLLGWVERFPIRSIEDPLAEDDAEGFRAFTAAVSGRCQVIGDDYLVTHADRVSKAAQEQACTAVLIKPNQAGTISEARAAFTAARAHGMATIISARSGESEDTTIAHLAVGWDAGQFKVGSFTRSERMAKWNEMLRIEESLAGSSLSLGFAGGSRLVLAAP
jgi:enolase